MKLMIREGFIDFNNDIDTVNDFIDKNIKELQRVIRSSGYDLDLESRRNEYALNPGIKKAIVFDISPRGIRSKIGNLRRALSTAFFKIPGNEKFGFGVSDDTVYFY